MDLFRWIFLAGFGIFFTSAIYSMIRILILGHADPSKSTGRIGPAVLYALTASMSPFKKESAYLHLPTYTAGLLYHTGIFLGLVLVFLHFFDLSPAGSVSSILAILLVITGASGVGILIKRIVKPKMRKLSNPDDYASNLLVTCFQLFSALALRREDMLPALFVYAGLLLLYIPVSKLRHAIYFATSRIYLGIIFGRRGVWPSGRDHR